jgi:hypothetical protein
MSAPRLTIIRELGHRTSDGIDVGRGDRALEVLQAPTPSAARHGVEPAASERATAPRRAASRRAS